MIRRVTMRGGAGSCVDSIDQAADANATDAQASAHAENRAANSSFEADQSSMPVARRDRPMASHLRWPVVFDLVGLGDIAGRRGPQVFGDLGAVDPRRQFQAKFGLRTQKARVWHGLLPIRCDSCFDTGERV